MRRLLIILLLACLSLYGMEEIFITKEESALDRESLNNLLVDQAIHVSLEETNNWEIIPPEVKVYLFSFVPQELKSLMLINHECYNLTKELFFLKAVAVFIIDKNLEKAVNLYAQTYEEDNTILAQALLDAHLYKKVIDKMGLDMFSKESSIDASFDPIIINEMPDDTTAFIKAIIQLFPKAARTIFIKAAGQDLSLIKICLKNGIDLTTSDINDNSTLNMALWQAASGNQIKIIQLLIDKGVGINAKNILGTTALILASMSNHLETVEYLLNHGANVNVRDVFGKTALIFAAKFGNVEIIKSLLHRKANIEGKPYSSFLYDQHTSPLIEAAEYGHLEAVNLLLSLGANINSIDKDNNSALHFATYNKHHKIIKNLIEKGAPINAKNKNGLTPLMIATIGGNLDTVKLLLALNANPHMQTKRYKKGKTAFIYACLCGHVDIVEELLPVSNINAKDEHDKTALQLILNKIKKCKDFDNVNAQNYLQIMALLNRHATEEGKLSIIDNLIQSTYGKLDDQNFQRTIVSVTSSLIILGIIQCLSHKKGQ